MAINDARATFPFALIETFLAPQHPSLPFYIVANGFVGVVESDAKKALSALANPPLF